jgi:Ca-activated chloride channel homolog
MKLRLVLAALAVSGLAAWAFAQQAPRPAKPAPPAQQDEETTRIQVDVNRVNLLFTVTDKKGHFVVDLTRDDFEIIEAKKRQQIQEFGAETNLPLRLGVLVDTSNSIRDRFKFEQEAASEFLRSTIKSNHDKAMVVSFDSAHQVAADLTDEPDRLDKAIRGLRPGGGTSLYDAIYFSCRDKLQQDVPKHLFRRALILVTDGEDTLSHYTRDQALEMAQRAEVVIYAISTNITRIESDGDKVLRYLTAETGGRAFFPFKVEQLERSFVDIADELRNQYNISYSPDPLVADGKFHLMELRVKGRKDLVVNARKGYYAPRARM